MCWLRVWQCADQLLIELTKNSLLVFWWWLVRAEVVVWGLRSALHIHRETNFDGIRLNFRCYISLYRLRGQLERETGATGEATSKMPWQNMPGKTAGASVELGCVCTQLKYDLFTTYWKKGKQYGEYHHLFQCFVLWVVSTNINLSSAFVPLFLSHTSTLI